MFIQQRARVVCIRKPPLAAARMSFARHAPSSYSCLLALAHACAHVPLALRALALAFSPCSSAQGPPCPHNPDANLGVLV